MPTDKLRATLDKHPAAWAWRLEGGELCFWADTSRHQLQRRKPSPGAKAVRVRLVPIGDYKEMIYAD